MFAPLLALPSTAPAAQPLRLKARGLRPSNPSPELPVTALPLAPTQLLRLRVRGYHPSILHPSTLAPAASLRRPVAQLLRLKVRGYIPDFKLAFEHFCLHTGGRGVIDAIEKQLELRPEHVAPSRETLYRYGNISSSSIW